MFLCVLVPDILCSSFARCARVCDIWHGPIFADFAWVDGFSTPIYAESCRQTSTDLHDCWMLAFEPSVKVCCVRKGRTAHDHETLNCRTPPVLNATLNRKSSIGSGLEVPRFCNRGAAGCSCHWLVGRVAAHSLLMDCFTPVKMSDSCQFRKTDRTITQFRISKNISGPYWSLTGATVPHNYVENLDAVRVSCAR